MMAPEVIVGFPGFSDLSREQLARIASHAVRRRVRRGEYLWHEGDEATALTLIQRGRIKLVKHGPSARDALIEVAGPGSIIGEIAVYDGGRQPISAIALGDVEVVQLPVQDAISVLAASPQAVLSVLGSLARHIRGLTQRAADLGEAGVERRLALAMCRLCGKTCEKNAGPPTGPIGIPVALSRQDLADMVGTSMETAIRILSRWSRRGVVLSHRGGFLVQDCAALQSIVALPPRASPHRDGEARMIKAEKTKAKQVQQ